MPKLLDGEQEAQLIAPRLGPPPPGCGTWSLRLLTRLVVEVGIVASISHEPVRRSSTIWRHGVQATELGDPARGGC